MPYRETIRRIQQDLNDVSLEIFGADLIPVVERISKLPQRGVAPIYVDDPAWQFDRRELNAVNKCINANRPYREQGTPNGPVLIYP